MKLHDEFATNIEVLLREEIIKCGYEWGIDFTTQYPMRYGHIIDIAFPKIKLAIEADGEPWHSPEKDAVKNYVLKKHGWTVLRFKGNDILTDIAACIAKIKEKIKELS